MSRGKRGIDSFPSVWQEIKNNKYHIGMRINKKIYHFPVQNNGKDADILTARLKTSINKCVLIANENCLNIYEELKIKK